jgi:hypothetical protein
MHLKDCHIWLTITIPRCYACGEHENATSAWTGRTHCWWRRAERYRRIQPPIIGRQAARAREIAKGVTTRAIKSRLLDGNFCVRPRVKRVVLAAGAWLPKIAGGWFGSLRVSRQVLFWFIVTAPDLWNKRNAPSSSGPMARAVKSLVAMRCVRWEWTKLSSRPLALPMGSEPRRRAVGLARPII